MAVAGNRDAYCQQEQNTFALNKTGYRVMALTLANNVGKRWQTP